MAKKSIAKKRKKHNRKKWGHLPPFFRECFCVRVFVKEK